MGSKGTSTQTQQGTSTYTPSAATTAAGNQALSMATNAANQPFNLPVAPVAGFNPQQQQAFQQYGNLQNIYQPYYNQAQGYFNQSAAPITGQDVSQYLNPYAGYVLGNLREQQGQQMNQLTGQATQTAGGVGADRIGVAQGELARQQGLATGQTLSGLYGSALQAAQQQKQMAQSAGYGLGQLGGANLQSAIGATNALYGSGATQQQLAQAQQNAQYQNQLQRQAYPFQTAQYLANITGGLAGALGGTTTTGQYGTSTPAAPSLISQIGGLGTAGFGLYNALGGFGGSPSYGGGNFFSGDAYGGSSANPLPGLSASDYGAGYADGGGIDGDWMNTDPIVPSGKVAAAPVNIPKIDPMKTSGGSGGGGDSVLGDIASIAGTAAKFLPLLLAEGGAVMPSPYPQHFADGGFDPTDEERQRGFDLLRQGFAEPERQRGLDYLRQGFADPQRQIGYELLRQGKGIRAPDSIPGGEAPPINPDQPYRMPDQPDGQNPYTAWQQDRTIPENATPTRLTVNPDAAPAPAASNPYADLSPAAANIARQNLEQMQGQRVDLPYGDLDHKSDLSRELARNPWMALVAAGLGIASGTSPYAAVNIGKGGLEGLKTLETQRKESREEEGVNQRAKQLALQAQQHLDQYSKLTPAQAATIEHQKQVQEESRWQIVYDPTSGKAFWTKPGETPIPAMPGQTAPPAPLAGAAPPVPGGTAPMAGPPPGATAPAAPPAAPAPSANPISSLTYHPPSTNPETGPGPVFNPKTGMPDPVNQAASKKSLEDARNRANNASSMSLQLGELEHQLDNIDKLTKDAGGFLQPGTYATQRFAIAKGINSALAPLGIQPFDPSLVGSAEAAGKLTTQLGFALSRTLGAREAQMIVQQAISANPGIENTPEGRRYILAAMKQAINLDREKSQFITDYYKQWRTTTGAEQEFNRQNPPEKYLVQAGIASAPPEFQKPEALAAAVKKLRENPNDPKVVGLFNKIYHDTAPYFLRGQQ